MTPRTISTHCDFHLGDNLAHLHLLRDLALRHPPHRFLHAVHACHLKDLAEAVEDRQNIYLIPMEARDAGSIDVWKNAGGFWESHALRNDYAGFCLENHRHVAAKMGLESRFTRPEELLFDYPALIKRHVYAEMQGPLAGAGLAALPNGNLFDFLIVNSQPCSGQFMEYDRVDFFDPLIAELIAVGKRVVVTQKSAVPGAFWTGDCGLTITGIGSLSLDCTHHVMVSTGPSWPTLNIWNQSSSHGSSRVRILLLERERVNLDPLVHCVSTLAAARRVLQENSLLP
jgi:hypothetical protein